MMHVMRSEEEKDKWVWRCDCGRILWIRKTGGITIIREGDYKADHTGFTVRLPEEE